MPFEDRSGVTKGRSIRENTYEIYLQCHMILGSHLKAGRISLSVPLGLRRPRDLTVLHP